MPLPKDPLKIEEWKRKQRESHLGIKRGPLSIEHKEKISKGNTGKKRTLEQRERISNSLSGRKLSQEHIKNVILGRAGYRPTEETKRKIGEANKISLKGKKQSEESNKKRSEKLKGRISPRKGQKVSEETKRKISVAKTGHITTLETRKRIGDAQRGEKANNYGKSPPLETRKKISKSLIGKVCGEKHYNWTGGPKEYCDKWNNEFRGRITSWNAYNHNGVVTCECCGATTNGNRGLNRHHVYYDKKACCAVNENGIYYSNLGIKDATHDFEIVGDPNKFVVICDRCHARTNNKKHRVFWARYYEKIINEKYNGKSYFTKEEMNAFQG